MAERRIVRISHEASYADPISVEKGDPLLLSGREDLWDGHRWLWAAADGKEGWIPEILAVERGGDIVASQDYSARELTCAAGDALEVLRCSHGWAWCRDRSSREGWVPLRNLSER